MCSVDVTKSMSITFTVEESLKGIYTRRFSDSKVLVVENSRTSSNMEWKSGQASNISFMLIDKETGKVEFLYKNDIDSETSAEIPAKEGMISAVFIKQSTSGMFWFSEKVDNSAIGATIECLKANNPSYTGYNTIAYGAGEHDLEFKSGKWATYTFNAGVEVNGDDGYLEYNEPAEDTSAGDKDKNKKK